MKTRLLLLLALAFPLPLRAGSATWAQNPVDNDWSHRLNWTPHEVPRALPDSASFAQSSETQVIANFNASIAALTFEAGASAYTISTMGTATVFISRGMFNDSGIEQDFVLTLGDRGKNGSLEFYNYASVDPSCVITCAAGATIYTGELGFSDHSSAGGAMIINEGCTVPGAYGAHTDLVGHATGANATFINNGGAADGAVGGETNFFDTATAGDATYINNGGTAAGALGGSTELVTSDAANSTMIANGSAVPGAAGGRVVFFTTTHATTATLIANGGTNGGEGGTVSFGDQSYGDTARVEVFGNGVMEDATSHSKALTIGSLEGDGIVTLNSNHPLSVGGTNVSTTFSGLLQNPTSGAGSLTKTGTGTLTLTGANTYTGQTMVGAGTLAVGNTSGSATGTGLVYINIGTLGGGGIIGGPLTIGTGRNGSATLAPALGGSQPATLTAKSTLTFQSNGIYACTFTATKTSASSDEVVAKGVTITPGAVFTLTGTGSLQEGSVLTVISNTSKTPINGTFSNLADGTILTVNGQNLQASYEGGDGNDLTLTVVP